MFCFPTVLKCPVQKIHPNLMGVTSPLCPCVGGCRGVGPVDGERPVFFGHARKAPKPADWIRFRPSTDVVPGVTVAFRLSDEDATAWARIFDVGLCVEVLDPDGGNGYDVRHIRLQLYACRGVLPDCPPESDDFRSEEVQLNMPWYLTEQIEVVPCTAVISEQWVDRRGYLFPKWRENLRTVLPLYHGDLE